MEQALVRIRPTTDPREGAGADLLSESVPEIPEIKAQVLARFNDICPPHAVFATNTSLLAPSMFAAATGRPAQFAALHFHTYVWDANLVDVMPHPGTSEATLALLREFALRIGQTQVMMRRENPGYVFNALFGALTRAALDLAARGVAAPEDVDRA